MNGNRMKYASTPTYGMQKRSFFKKSAPVHQAPEAPDFSKAPATANAIPFPQTFTPSAQQQPFVQQPANASAPFPVAPLFPQATPVQQTAQIPFAAPAFIPPAAGLQLPPMNNPTQPPFQQLPLGNTISGMAPTASFSMRSQGFVPPQIPAVNAVAPTQPMQAPAAPAFSATQQPFAGMNPPAAPQAPVAFTPIPPQPPVFQPPVSRPADAQQSFPGAQPAAFTPAVEPVSRQSMNADKLWSVFLFGLVPLLFIPCLFVPGSWNFLRYAFIALAVAGLGVVWYRQMFSSAVRIIISTVFLALSIAVIAMLVQGGNDVRQVAANTAAQNAPQQQVAAEGQYEPEPEPTAVQATPVPPAAGSSEAERRLELFMSLWQMNKPDEMVSLVQPSWCSQQENPSQALFNVLKNRTAEDYKIEDITGTETDNSRTITMRATINKNTGKAPSIYRFMIMMVKEGNEWYVNPNSLATNDEVKTTDENVVNNKNAVGDYTEPPRTTVTPAPPASTQLYYNDGANYYHMDPNCASVKSEYLPFDFSFSYSDLKAVRKEYNLSPCLKCNAPTNTLD